LFDLRTITKLEDNPLSANRDYLFNIRGYIQKFPEWVRNEIYARMLPRASGFDGFIWLRIWTSGGVFGFHKMQEISWLT